MCRNIKTLFNFDPPATSDEVRAASLQFVRKLSGFNKPSKANELAFELAVERVAAVAQELLALAGHDGRAARSRGRGGPRSRARRAALRPARRRRDRVGLA